MLVEAAAQGAAGVGPGRPCGGLAVAIAEGCIWSGLGAELDLAVGSTPALELFGEAPSRAVVSTTPEDWERLAAWPPAVACRWSAWAASAAIGCTSA